MTNAIDNNILSLLLHPDARPPFEPGTKQPLSFVRERLDALVDTWNSRGDRLIIPTPVLSEFLDLAGLDGNAYLAELKNLTTVYIRPFDERCAIELAAMNFRARSAGEKRAPAAQDTPWQKVKVDRQIVAIAKVHRADAVYSDDPGVRAFAEAEGMRVVSTWDLPVPAQPQSLPLTSGFLELD